MHITWIDWHNIKPNRFQPRQSFEQETLEELAMSIKVCGIIQPITVYEFEPGHYELVAGERRWRAAYIAGMKSVPCNVIETPSDEDLASLAIIENLQREQVNPIEEAEGLSDLRKKGYSVKEIADLIGKSRPAISNSLRLLKLSDEIKKQIASGEMSVWQGLSLLTLQDEKLREELAGDVVKKKMPLTEIDRRISKLQHKKQKYKIKVIGDRNRGKIIITGSIKEINILIDSLRELDE